MSPLCRLSVRRCVALILSASGIRIRSLSDTVARLSRTLCERKWADVVDVGVSERSSDDECASNVRSRSVSEPEARESDLVTSLLSFERRETLEGVGDRDNLAKGDGVDNREPEEMELSLLRT